MDFTIKTYKQLLNALQKQGFLFQTFQNHIGNKEENKLILRHDVDKLPINSLSFARIQSEIGIMGTYYFRIVPQSFDESIIKEITSLGHEVGYHYETLDTCKGDVDKAYDEFCRNLESFRKITEIKTISMHGSPLSKFDNREIWKKYDYKKLGIIGEPYFDLDFNDVFYITDTGRRWDGDRFNVRDKPMKETERRSEGETKRRSEGETKRRSEGETKRRSEGETKRRSEGETKRRRDLETERRRDEWTEETITQSPKYRTTNDIIKAVESGTFPSRAMFNFHPQRWSDKMFPWVKELVWQNVKNQGKRVLLRLRD